LSRTEDFQRRKGKESKVFGKLTKLKEKCRAIGVLNGSTLIFATRIFAMILDQVIKNYFELKKYEITLAFFHHPVKIILRVILNQ